MTSKIPLFALFVGLAVIARTFIHAADPAQSIADWPQWARASLQANSTRALGQSPKVKLAEPGA